MGRNKIKIEKIKNERIRKVTFYKRKKGLLKKAMELSLLCDVKVFLCIVDKNDKLTLFTSEEKANTFIEKYLGIPIQAREIYMHKDYKTVFSNAKDRSEPSSPQSQSDEESQEEYSLQGHNREKNCQSTKVKQTRNKNGDLSKDDSIFRKDTLEKNISDEGISKIKSRLSLKVKIPDTFKTTQDDEVSCSDNENPTDNFNKINKNQSEKIIFLHKDTTQQNNRFTANGLSFQSSCLKKMEKDFLEPLKNQKINILQSPVENYQKSYTKQIVNPLVQNENLSQKRYRDDYLPVFSPAGEVFKQMTPLGNFSGEISSFFMFNQGCSSSLTPTPMNMIEQSFEYSSDRPEGILDVPKITDQNTSSMNENNSNITYVGGPTPQKNRSLFMPYGYECTSPGSAMFINLLNNKMQPQNQQYIKMTSKQEGDTN